MGLGAVSLSFVLLLIRSEVFGLSLNGPQQRILTTLKPNDDGFESPSRDAPFHNSCPLDAPESCSALSATGDTCCYESTNGLMVMTQYWGSYPALGPNDTFTVHGLWGNKCNGGYNQFCNPEWEIDSPVDIWKSTNNSQLLDEMNHFWPSSSGKHEDLWLHEFNKHGSCMYTLNPSCYSHVAPEYQYAADYFRTVMDLYHELPTFEWLTDAGIYPSVAGSFTEDQFQNALRSKLGVDSAVTLYCDRSNNLNQVRYYFNLKGSVANGVFVPRNAVSKGNCKAGFGWKPKGWPIPPPNRGSNRGCLRPTGQGGGLNSKGQWFTGGDCATFRLKEAEFGGIEVYSSKGPCNVQNGFFTCGRNIKAGQFTQDKESGVIVYDGDDSWSADHKPARGSPVPISQGTNGGTIQFKSAFVGK